MSFKPSSSTSFYLGTHVGQTLIRQSSAEKLSATVSTPKQHQQKNSASTSSKWMRFHSFIHTSLFAKRMEVLRTRQIEWEIERADSEMRVRLFFDSNWSLPHYSLPSGRHGSLWWAPVFQVRNIKLDLMRRIKIFEYALHMERSVYSFSLYMNLHLNNYSKIQPTHATNFYKTPYNSSKCSLFFHKDDLAQSKRQLSEGIFFCNCSPRLSCYFISPSLPVRLGFTYLPVLWQV